MDARLRRASFPKVNILSAGFITDGINICFFCYFDLDVRFELSDFSQNQVPASEPGERRLVGPRKIGNHLSKLVGPRDGWKWPGLRLRLSCARKAGASPSRFRLNVSKGANRTLTPFGPPPTDPARVQGCGQSMLHLLPPASPLPGGFGLKASASELMQ